MLKKILVLSLVIFALPMVQCSSKQKSGEAKVLTPSWQSSMQGMATNLEVLAPYLFAKEEYSSPDNREKIRTTLRDFTLGVEQIPQHIGEAMLGKDPIIQYSLKQLETGSHRALRAFNEGQHEYSRKVMRDNIGACFSCHSTQRIGPTNNFSDTSLTQNFKIRTTERADFYIATRQFDKAASVLEAVLKDERSVLDNTQEQMDSLRKYLVLQIRARKKPQQALFVLNQYMKNRKLPYFLARDLEAWRKSLQVLVKDFESGNLQRGDSLAQALALVRKAESTQEVNGYQTGFVNYLRATEILHTALRGTNEPLRKAKMYELLGYAYETLPEVGFWDLPQIYYETCIRTLPKSAVAKSCYKNFERTIVIGYSGSAGIFIPQDERTRLNELEVLSGI